MADYRDYAAEDRAKRYQRRKVKKKVMKIARELSGKGLFTPSQAFALAKVIIKQTDKDAYLL